MRTPGRKDSGWKPAIPSGPRTLAVAESVRYTSRPGRKVGSCGAVAQLGERLGRIEEVVGSIPIGSIDPARPLSPLRKGAIAFEPSTNRPGMRLEPNIRFMTFFEGVVVFFQKKPSNTVDPAWFSHVLSDPDPEREDRPVTSDQERRWDGRETLGRKRRWDERDVGTKETPARKRRSSERSWSSARIPPHPFRADRFGRGFSFQFSRRGRIDSSGSV